MPRDMTTTILLYGHITTGSSEWLKWYDYAIQQIKSIGFVPNYIGVKGESFNSTKLTTIKRTEAKLKESFQRNEIINRISLYSLPDNFKTAAFDYAVYLSRDTDKGENANVMMTVSSSTFSQLNHQSIVDNLKSHIQFSSGQIFEMVGEDPLIYALKANPPTSFKTLRVITEF